MALERRGCRHADRQSARSRAGAASTERQIWTGYGGLESLLRFHEMPLCLVVAERGGHCAAPSGGGSSFVVERREKLVECATGAIEIAAGQLLAPSLFEIGDGLSGAIEHSAALGGREDELCSAVGGIGMPFEVTEVL
ncbi:MAG: hypothetical protein JWM72_728 [Actinomycetia bacterium]|nr:hypothetical protein [Actinomycetes bacterium]